MNPFIDAIAVPVWLQRGELVLHVNAAMQRLSGRSPADWRAADALAAILPDDADLLRQLAHESLQGQACPPARAARLHTRDGSVRHVELTLRCIELDGYSAAVVTCLDHSDMRHVQSSLLSMSQLLRQIVDGAPVASFVIDREHRVTHWNSACERLTGCLAADMLGSTEAWRAFYSDQRPLLADLIVDGARGVDLAPLYGGRDRPSSLIQGAHEAETFFPNFGPDGRWLYFTAAPLRRADGEIIGAIETLQDVTQRRLAEDELTRHRNALEHLVQERTAELAASARELAAFIENAPIGVIYTARDQVLRSNLKFGETFGLAEGSAIGQMTRAFFLRDEDHADFLRLAGAQLSRGLPWQHEMWMRHHDGQPIWIQLNAHVANEPDHAEGGIWWMLQNRTEMRAAQEELRTRFEQLRQTNRQLEEAQSQLLQSDKMASIGQLAAGVAHEINNPIGFVSSNLNTLRDYFGELMSVVDAYTQAHDTPGDARANTQLADTLARVELDYLRDDLPQLLAESSEGLGRVKKIVHDLKDFSRVDQSDWQEADLNVGLESTLNVVRHEVKFKAEIVKRLSPLPYVTCLAGQLNQVFLNLIVNASHAIVERGVITLSSGTAGDWVWVQVDDTGCGMTDDVRRRIFEPFYTTKDVGKGTGLGLSLSFSIAQRHGGAILVRSTPGVGSQFRLWVPIRGPVPIDAPVAHAPPDWT